VEFPKENQSAWVIFSQSRTVNTKKNRKLYISFWVKKENMESGVVDLGIMQRKPWATIISTSVRVTHEWRKVELVVTPRRDCDNTRFQVSFTEPGTLYLSDIHVAETTKRPLEVNPIRLRMAREREHAAEKNMVRNASFEAGVSGWGTEGFDHNVVKIDKTRAYHGRCSARMDFDADSLPIGYSDYPKARRIVFTNVKCAGRGWMRFEKGAEYTLSVYLRSNKQEQKVDIGVFYMTRAKSVQGISVSNEWRRYSLTFTAQDMFGFPQISSSTVDFSEQLWIDAVQIERGDRATAFEARYPVEVAFHPKRPGGVYYLNEAIVFDVASWFRDDAARANVDWKVVDYQENAIHQGAFVLTENTVTSSIQIPVKGNGHYGFLATVKGDGCGFSVKTPFMIIYPYAKTYGNRDARFGTNHPYYSDFLQQVAQDAGVYWVRDWTLKWDNVEPEKGKWDFSGPTVFFDRAKRLDLRVLAILPDPSSGWASSGPPEARGKRLGDAYEDLWYLPRSMDDYRRYTRECIERCQDVTGVWEVLNEPFTSKTRQWNIEAEYPKLLAIVKEEAAKVNVDLKVMRCGLCYFGKHEAANARTARLADLLSEHTYPRYNDTARFLARTRHISEFLTSHDVETGIWITEYGKYSNDSPDHKHAGFDHYLSNGDERTATAYNIKYLTILFSHGASKVFFHQRTWPIGLNYKNNNLHFDMLFDYGPAPHKFFVAANAMCWILHPGTRAGVGVNETGPVFAYRFERPEDKVLVVWTDKNAITLNQPMQTLARGVVAYDMMGKRLEMVGEIHDEPIYLIGDAERINAIEEALAALVSGRK